MGSILSTFVSAVPVGRTVLAQANDKRTPSARRKFDKRVLLLFAVLAAVSIGVPSAFYVLTEGATAYEFASSAVGGLSFSFLVAGIPVYLRYGRDDPALRRRILRSIVILSVVMSAVAIAAVSLVSVYAPDIIEFAGLSATDLILTGLLMFVTVFVVFLLMAYAGLVAAFGVVGVLAALERLVTPWILVQVIRSGGTNEPSLLNRSVNWLFAIPDVIDTKTLTLRPTGTRERVSLSNLKGPVLWQLIFGFVLGVYISLNPFVSDRSPEALLTVFSVLATASTMFPFLVLPWFLFMRLGASIVGQTKHFTLYDGIRSRIFRSYFAVGTIVILVRLSIQEIAVAFETYVVAFAAFMSAVLVSSLLSTFVYLVYFENDLAEDIVDGLKGTDVKVVR